jgi:hypothetical protein
MRAAVGDGEELAADIEDSDIAALHLDQLALARSDVIHGSNDVTRHQPIP